MLLIIKACSEKDIVCAQFIPDLLLVFFALKLFFQTGILLIILILYNFLHYCSSNICHCLNYCVSSLSFTYSLVVTYSIHLLTFFSVHTYKKNNSHHVLTNPLLNCRSDDYDCFTCNSNERFNF